MTDCVLVRYSEIGLKGNNKVDFELCLIKNIKAQLKKEGINVVSTKRLFSRILIITDKKPGLTSVFGISSYSYSKITPPNIESVKKEVTPLIKDYTKDTVFRVSAKRLDKEFNLDSMAVEREIGSFVVKETCAKVNLKNFEKEIGIDILRNEIILFDNRIKGAGGLPVGIEGKALALIEDNNSIKAAILAMKRGCEIFPIGYEEKDISRLQEYSPKRLSFAVFNNIEEVEKIAKKIDAKALITGQTLENFNEIEAKLMVLRPLIAL